MQPIRNGFTLIEILIVIATIGILVATSIAGYTTSRAKSRDSARIADVQQIVTALGLYYGACYEYPDTLATTASNGCPSGTTLGMFIPSIPVDPLGSAYDYATSGAGNDHDAAVVRATLEQDTQELARDIDGASYKNVTIDCSDAPAYYYCLGS